MPLLLMDAVWMLGSRPSMTECGLAEGTNQGTHAMSGTLSASQTAMPAAG
jgi:hypothetical protein